MSSRNSFFSSFSDNGLCHPTEGREAKEDTKPAAKNLIPQGIAGSVQKRGLAVSREGKNGIRLRCCFWSWPGERMSWGLFMDRDVRKVDRSYLVRCSILLLRDQTFESTRNKNF